MELLSIIIKKLVLSGYNPAEDLLELGVNITTGMMRLNGEDIDAQLKAGGLAENQIKAAKDILAESADRFIPSTPAAVYERNADAMSVAQHIFKAYIDVKKTEEDVSKKIQLSSEDDDTKKQIIKAISIIVQKAIDLCLTSPDYSAYLTKQLNMAKAAINKTDSLVNVQNGQIIDHENRVANLEKKSNQRFSNTESDIEAYYDYVKGLFTKRYKGNTLLGEESLSELYMQPFYKKAKGETVDVELLLEEFCSKGESGVLWIVGEPGHGKTSMCIKAVSDYANKKRYQSVSGVFWFRLNPQGIPEMVENKKLALKTAFSWEKDGDRSETIKPDEIKGSLVFLDGFDELKATLEKNSISKNQFFIQVNQLSEVYQMHIVITSRTLALVQDETHILKDLEVGCAQFTCKFRDGSSLKNDVKLLAPLTFGQQILWIDELINWRKNNDVNTDKLENYRQEFPSLQKNRNIAGLLEVPILFRMIVQNSFVPTSSDRVILYRDLFDMTLLRQGLEHQQSKLHPIYREIAFNIFVHDDDCAEIDKEKFDEIAGSDAYLYQYYLHAPETSTGRGNSDKYCVTFLHRSFYQYFLSEFFYEELKSATNGQTMENFLQHLWPRHMDSYVLDNLRLRAKGKDIDYMPILRVIDETDAILSEYKNSNGSKESIGNYNKANNVFWNAISVCNTIFLNKRPRKKMDVTGRVIELLSKYTCSGIVLRCARLSEANLERCDLSGADLRKADLRKADLREADLKGADLRGADLRYANLSEAKLNGADLRGANLRGADLRYANLSEAKLNGADLSHANLQFALLYVVKLSDACISYANLSKAELNRADLSGAYLEGCDLSEADLRGADLSEAHIGGSDLRGADLRGACLGGCNLSGAYLSNADLNVDALRGADLSGELREGFPRKAILSDAKMEEANVAYAKVSRKQYEYISKANVWNLDKIIVFNY